VRGSFQSHRGYWRGSYRSRGHRVSRGRGRGGRGRGRGKNYYDKYDEDSYDYQEQEQEQEREPEQEEERILQEGASHQKERISKRKQMLPLRRGRTAWLRGLL